MKRNGGAAHVATTRRRYKGKVYEAHLVRQSYREDGKVKHRTLANLSKLPIRVIELVKAALKGEAVGPIDEAFEIQRNRPHGHVAAVLNTLLDLGLDRVIATAKSRMRALVLAMIVARIIDPRPKLATARSLQSENLHHSLAECLDVENADEDELYEAMDWLIKKQKSIEKKLAKRHLQEGTLVLYDVTSTYFEGRKCPLAKRGYSRDGKKNKLQIVIGLLTDIRGCPIAIEVFDGNTADPATVACQVQKVRQRFNLKNVVIVGDRGMLTSARLREDVAPEGLGWITSMRADQIRKLAEGEAIQMSLFDETDLVEIEHPDYPGERLVVCRNPALAAERKRKREELLCSSEKQLEKIRVAVKRLNRPLRGEAEIGIRLGRVMDRYKVAKHFRFEIGDEHFSYERKDERITQEAALDGLYVIRTDVSPEVLDADQVVQAYKSLSAVERAFRSLKTVDLNVRPIHHRKADRVRAHVLICMLAYYVEWHMRQKLAPLLFDDDDPVGREAQRSSVVAPAKRSPKAERKARTKKTEDGWLVQSFQSLLSDLGTLCKNRVAVPGTDHTFDLMTTPTSYQQRVFELLGLRLPLK
jgi:transposase